MIDVLAEQEADRSAAVGNLKERLEELSWLLEPYFGERIPLRVRFLTFDGLIALPPARDSFTIRLRDYVEFSGPEGLRMHVGFVPLIDLYGIQSILGRKFLERNIRFMLPPDGHVNRALRGTFASILLERSQSPALFAFHHNGLTLSAGLLDRKGDDFLVHMPRLLNGAQTVYTFAEFWDSSGPALRTAASHDLIDQLVVLTRIITQAKGEMITEITISNNRQNPVQSWQLHANDQIQFELEDWFRELGIPYQRQDRAFAKVGAADLQSMQYKETRAVELIRLARTYLAAEGELGKLSHIREVFENVRDYNDLFGPHRLNADPRRVILCYKAQYHLARLAAEIKEKGVLKYDFVNRTREIIWSLICQAILNDDDAESFAESFGHDLSRPHGFNERLRVLASTRVRFLLDELRSDKEYKNNVEDGNYSFMRSPGAFTKPMKYASKRWGWKTIPLR
jgi:AIPR protein